jgi:hypothetical protein
MSKLFTDASEMTKTSPEEWVIHGREAWEHDGTAEPPGIDGHGAATAACREKKGI